MSELYRVLKKRGHAVTQVPFSALLANSFEDPHIRTDKLRNLFYGQEDHVRVYGQDVFSRFEQAGFAVGLQKHGVVLADMDATFYGVNAKEDLILMSKGG